MMGRYLPRSRLPLTWEVMGIRGQDKHIADIDLTGFGGRKLLFGQGSVTRSPSELRFLLHSSSSSSKAGGGGGGKERTDASASLTEDDVMHADRLPTFGDTLSREESEQLLSYLTVPYVRVPLIAGFFSSRDRVTYLFNPALQSLLRSVLFEGGPWLPHSLGYVGDATPSGLSLAIQPGGKDTDGRGMRSPLFTIQGRYYKKKERRKERKKERKKERRKEGTMSRYLHCNNIALFFSLLSLFFFSLFFFSLFFSLSSSLSSSLSLFFSLSFSLSPSLPSNTLRRASPSERTH